jgi:dihydroxy-acid dehydratase
MSNHLRSDATTAGVQRAPNRAMLRAVGFGDGDFGKPIIGIANGYSTVTPCNAGLDVLARRAEAAVRAAGAMPQLFGTITVSDGISMGTEGMRYSLVSREVIADSIETVCGAESMDGVVAVGGCDKNMPAASTSASCSRSSAMPARGSGPAAGCSPLTPCPPCSRRWE